MTFARSTGLRLALAGLLVLALVPSACGGGSDDGDAAAGGSSDKQELLDAREEMLDAFYHGDADKFCSSVTPESRRDKQNNLNYGSCEAMVDAFVPKDVDLPPRPDLKVLAVKIDGDSGTVTTRQAKDERPVVNVYVKRDGVWLSDLTATRERQAAQQ